ncbi:MAG: hypothetical protein WBW93_09440 [Steroidobacteraceae bacterium]
MVTLGVIIFVWALAGLPFTGHVWRLLQQLARKCGPRVLTVEPARRDYALQRRQLAQESAAERRATQRARHGAALAKAQEYLANATDDAQRALSRQRIAYLESVTPDQYAIDRLRFGMN